MKILLLLFILVVIFVYELSPKHNLNPTRPTELKTVTATSITIENPADCNTFICAESKSFHITTSEGTKYLLSLDSDTYVHRPDFLMYQTYLQEAKTLTLKYYTMNGFTCAYGLYADNESFVDLSHFYDRFQIGDYSYDVSCEGDCLKKVDNICFKYNISLIPNEAH